MSWLARIANALRSPGVARGIDEERAPQIESRIADLVAGGLTRDAAAAMARRQRGTPPRRREPRRALTLRPWLDALLRDVRLGARMSRRNRLVTAAVIVSLSLTLGAGMAAFSLVDALILRPLPVHQPERLIYLTVPSGNPDVVEDAFSDPEFVRLRDAGRGLVDVFAVGYLTKPRVTFDVARGERETVRAQFVSGDAFARLGVAPAAGRLLMRQDDERAGAPPVAVLSHAFWMQRFGGDAGIIGHWFVLHDGHQERRFQIVGVTEPRFRGVEPGYATDVWMPYAMQHPDAFGNSGYRTLRVMGRVKEGAALGQIRGALQLALTTFRREDVTRHFSPGTPPDRVARFVNTPLSVRSAANGPSRLRVRFQRALWFLAAIAGLTLLVAGSNVAHLLLAQTAAREREMSLRLSLGAGRTRLVQQMLVQSTLVAGAACLVGVMFAGLAAPALVRLLSSTDDPVVLDLRVDWRLVAFVGAMTVLSSALLGLAPAWRASGVAPMGALKAGGGRASTRASAARLFVATQVAFSLTVLFVGGLLVRSFVKLTDVNPGFATSDVLDVSWEAVHDLDADRQNAALLEVLDRLRELPGVAAVGAAEGSVFGGAWRTEIPTSGNAGETIEATMAPVTPGFFETMEIPLLAGRTFVRGDLGTDGPTVVVVNSSFAKRYFGGQPAVGRRFDARFGTARAPNEVVGVVADVRYNLREAPAPTIYILLPFPRFDAVYVRSARDARVTASQIREAVRAAAPLLRVTAVTPLAALVDRTLVRERLLALLSGFFALVGLALTAVGLYGTLSHEVVRRTREIGIRVALGSRALGAVRPVLADTAGMTLIGAACGVAGGLYATRAVERMLFEVTARDVWSLALPLGTLLLAAVVAAWVPAWRAARVDPAIALRNE